MEQTSLYYFPHAQLPGDGREETCQSPFIGVRTHWPLPCCPGLRCVAMGNYLDLKEPTRTALLPKVAWTRSFQNQCSRSERTKSHHHAQSPQAGRPPPPASLQGRHQLFSRGLACGATGAAGGEESRSRPLTCWLPAPHLLLQGQKNPNKSPFSQAALPRKTKF